MVRLRLFYFINMSCENCFQGAKGKDEALSVVRVSAREKAIESGSPIAIVSENSEWVFYDAFYAYSNNLQVKEVVSHL